MWEAVELLAHHSHRRNVKNGSGFFLDLRLRYIILVGSLILRAYSVEKIGKRVVIWNSLLNLLYRKWYLRNY